MKKNRVDNKQFAKSKWFIDVCNFAGVVPTRRQASKYRNKKGKAFNYNYPNGTSPMTDKKMEVIIKKGFALLGKWGSLLREHERI